jgi:hypothetical protein
VGRRRPSHPIMMMMRDAYYLGIRQTWKLVNQRPAGPHAGAPRTKDWKPRWAAVGHHLVNAPSGRNVYRAMIFVIILKHGHSRSPGLQHMGERERESRRSDGETTRDPPRAVELSTKKTDSRRLSPRRFPSSIHTCHSRREDDDGVCEQRHWNRGDGGHSGGSDSSERIKSSVEIPRP